jgi:predicted MPP superfamily phosphohydrolase
MKTDKGTKIILLADAHFLFYIEAALRKDWSNEEYNIMQITNCYIYGLNTRNIYIKGLWR